jgi:hypothetical protein
MANVLSLHTSQLRTSRLVLTADSNLLLQIQYHVAKLTKLQTPHSIVRGPQTEGCVLQGGDVVSLGGELLAWGIYLFWTKYESKTEYIFLKALHHHHHHHHWLDSPTWTLVFLRSFFQLKYPAIASSDFVTRVFSRVGLSAPRPNPGYIGGPMFSVRVVSHSRLVPILKRQDLAFCLCMT